MLRVVQEYLHAHFVSCTKFVEELDNAIVAVRGPEVVLPLKDEVQNLSGWALSVPCLLSEYVSVRLPVFGVVHRWKQFWLGVCPEFSASALTLLLNLSRCFLHFDVWRGLGS